MTRPRRSYDPRAVLWSQLHHDIDPARVPLLLPWLRGLWALAARLRRVPPTAITVTGVVLAVAAVLTAARLPWAAAALVVASALCDGLDGAVAVVADRAGAAGARADAVADRICDALFAAVLWRCGAPWWLATAAALSALAADGLRRLRRVPSRITVAERPTFTICTVLACGSSALSSQQWPVTVCAAVWVTAALVALTQLAS